MKRPVAAATLSALFFVAPRARSQQTPVVPVSPESERPVEPPAVVVPPPFVPSAPSAAPAAQAEPPSIEKPGAPSAPALPSESPAPPGTPDPAAQGGYFGGSGGGFVLRTENKSYRLRIGLQSALRGQVRFREGEDPRVANPFMTLRPLIEGNIFKKWIRFWTSLELASNPTYLLDSYVEIQPLDLLGFRLGQQWTPFSRHEAIYGPMDLLLPDWDVVADYFWSGRDKGATIFGATTDQVFDYAVGAYLGSPLRQFEPIHGNYLFVGRVGLNPLGPVGSEFAYTDAAKPAPVRLALGANGYASKATSSVENFNPSTFKFETTVTGETTINQAGGADVFLVTPRVVSLVEGYVRRTDPGKGAPKYTSAGGFAQVGVLLYERELDASVRFSLADVNLDKSNDVGYGIEACGTWYLHAPQVFFKARYAFGHQQLPASVSTNDAGQMFSGGAPLIIPPGSVHVVTLQVNTSL